MKEIYKINFSRMLFALAVSIVMLFNQCSDPASLNALVVSDGEQEIKESLVTILENTGLFNANISKGNTMDFTAYDVVVLHLSEDSWSPKVKEDFIAYVNSGGGAVLVGNTVNAFTGWNEFMDISGIESLKPIKKSNSTFSYQLANSKEEHPILEGLNQKWMHPEDYLLYSTLDIGSSMEVLATAWADTLQGGDGTQVPVLGAHNPGEGRVFFTSLGIGAKTDNLSPIQCVGFITTLQRGAEWSATGVVSQEVTIDFPNSVSVHEWVDLEPLDLDEILSRASTYEVGKSKKYLDDFTVRIRMSDGKQDTYAQFEDMIIDFLNSDATVDSKRYMCKELSWIGSEKSISVLEKLVNDKDLSESAAYALQRLRM